MYKEIIQNISFRLRPYPFKKHQISNKYIFIHIPKNAGTALVGALGDLEQRRIHLPYFVYRNANREYFKHFFKFSIVRNPWDRVVSMYAYLKNGGNQFADMHFKEYFQTHNMTFDKFLLEYLSPQRLHSHSLLKPQFSFIFDEREKLMVDYIGRQETLNESLSVISSKIHIPVKQLTTINASQRQDYRTYYENTEQIDRVKELYAKDVQLLNYDFEPTARNLG